MSIAILDPTKRVSAPQLHDGTLSVSGLCTWLRMTADQAERRAASDWQRAREVYRSHLAAALRERVDPKLIEAVRVARQARIDAEQAANQAREVVALYASAHYPRSVGEHMEQQQRVLPAEQADQVLQTARAAEGAALSALRAAALPIIMADHDRAALLVQEATRAAKALVDDARHARRVIEQVDIERLLLSD